MYIDFEYAGKRLSDFGYTICKFGGSSDLTDVEIGCDITFSTVKNNHSSIHYNTSSSYENVYTTSLEIMKDPCNKNQDEMYHINEEISMLTSWLNRREYHKFKPLTEEDNLYSVHYYGSFNVKEKTINDRVVGFVLSFTGSAPYGFGEQIVNEIDMNCNDVTASGTILSITDSAEAKPNIKTFGKSKQKQYEGRQLYDISQIRTYGSQIVVDDNDWITVTLDNTNGTSNLYREVYVSATDMIKEGKAYLFVCEVKTNALSYLEISSYESTSRFQFDTAMTINPKLTGFFTKKITAKEDFSEAIYMLRTVCRAEPGQSGSVTFRISVIEDTTVTADTFVYEPFVGGSPSPSLTYQQEVTPIGESGSVKHTLYARNLIDWNDKLKTEINGLTNSIQSDGGIRVVGTNTAAYSTIASLEKRLPAGTYFISGGDRQTLYAQAQYKDEISGSLIYATNRAFTLTKETLVYISVQTNNDLIQHNTVIYPMLNIGSEKAEFSPYVKEQTITLQTPNGLHGIPLGATIPDAIKNSPIHMSGVYWDELEQQYYISDTKNENGKDVQRIRQVAISSAKYTDDMSIYMGALSTVACFRIAHDVFRSIKETPVMCNKLINKRTWNRDYEACYHTEANGVDINIKYETLGITSDATSDERVLAVRAWLENNELVLCDILAEPIITDVSEEDQAQYDSIHMNCPNTTLVNDAGAYMEVTYLQDYDNEFVICGVSDEYGTFYPNISITCKQDGDLRIKNTITGNVFEVLNCSEGETIYVNGEHKFIDSDNEKHKNSTLFNDFNYEYLKLQVEDNDFNENVFEVSLPCVITIGYYPIRKVGM